jgi:ABC-type polysaccharide/polyol phosphate export permease
VNGLVAARRHAPLFRNLVKREVRQRYRASALGLVWTLVNPIVVVLAYWFVFRFVFEAGRNEPYALFLFTGLSVWAVFMGAAQAAASSLVANASLVTKVRFPRQIVPLSAMTGQWFTAAAMFVIAVPLCLILADGRSLALIAVPPMVVLLAVFAAGFGLLVAAVNVYFRDTQHILDALAVPWFFLTPILYSFDMLTSIGADSRWAIDVLHYGNPISPFVLAIRDALFNGDWPASGDVVYCAIAAAVMLTVGVLVFRRLEREMAVEL